jgi:hypothetical protein
MSFLGSQNRRYLSTLSTGTLRAHIVEWPYAAIGPSRKPLPGLEGRPV